MRMVKDMVRLWKITNQIRTAGYMYKPRAKGFEMNGFASAKSRKC